MFAKHNSNSVTEYFVKSRFKIDFFDIFNALNINTRICAYNSVNLIKIISSNRFVNSFIISVDVVWFGFNWDKLVRLRYYTNNYTVLLNIHHWFAQYLVRFAL